MTWTNINAIGILAEDIISSFVTINNLTATTLNLLNPIKYLLYLLIIHNHIGKIILQD